MRSISLCGRFSMADCDMFNYKIYKNACANWEVSLAQSFAFCLKWITPELLPWTFSSFQICFDKHSIFLCILLSFWDRGLKMLRLVKYLLKRSIIPVKVSESRSYMLSRFNTRQNKIDAFINSKKDPTTFFDKPFLKVI